MSPAASAAFAIGSFIGPQCTRGAAAAASCRPDLAPHSRRLHLLAFSKGLLARVPGRPDEPLPILDVPTPAPPRLLDSAVGLLAASLIAPRFLEGLIAGICTWALQSVRHGDSANSILASVSVEVWVVLAVWVSGCGAGLVLFVRA